MARQVVLIVGGGVFGLSASLELRSRGHEVVVFDRAPLPAYDGSSNDISRIVRMDYGDDELYTTLAHQAIKKWKIWNNEIIAEGHEQLYQESGIAVLSREELAKGGYEKDSWDAVTKQGIKLQKLSRKDGSFPGAVEILKHNTTFADGYFNPKAGWANAGATVSFMARKALRAGVKIVTGTEGEFAGFIEQGKTVVGITTADGKQHKGDLVLVAAGAWSPSIVPELENLITAVGQPVTYFQVPPTLVPKFESGNTPVLLADISKTGYYCFPVARGNNLFKIGNHGSGFIVNKNVRGRVCSVPDSTVPLPASEIAAFKRFVDETYPDLRGAEVVKSRLCWYCDSWDGDFYIDHVPGKKGLVVACGSSGHGFKFSPVIGEIIADAVENKPNTFGKRFKWRIPEGKKAEACRKTDGNPVILSRL